jgi:histidyl-tRNA synthetase
LATAACAFSPEVTNYVRSLGSQRLKASKVFYIARCFRDETTTDAERLREFTQVGVEMLGDSPLDCRKVVRRDALRLFKMLLPETAWSLDDGVERGLNLYSNPDKTFEVTSTSTRKQLLGGGPYKGGAGWALGLERLMLSMEV